MANRGHKFGQRRPPLSVTITGILEEYPDGQIFKEIIQNADDAGARTVRFYLDSRQHRTQSLVHRDLARFQGPALLAYNDATFEEVDWEGIQNLQRSGKKEDPMKVGKFGIGFNSVYHIIDVPVIISGEKVAFMEPREEIWPRESGRWYHVSECHADYSDSVSPFYGVCGFSADTNSFSGTLFRFPLRNIPTELSKKLYTIQKLRGLLDALKKEAKLLLLFLRSVDTIEVFEINSQGQQSEVFRVSVLERDEVYKKRRDFRTRIESAHREYGYAIQCNIQLEANFHVEVTDRTNASATQINHWLLASKVGSQNGSILEMAEDQCAFPWVGVALELNEHDSSSVCPGGRTFCFLPMPEEASCFLPVHVNGTFGVDKDRRGLKWPSTERQDDPTANWNVLLVQHMLPFCYVALLARAKQLLTPKAFYTAWPDVSNVKQTNWSGLLHPLFNALFATRSIWSQVSGSTGEWVTPSEGLFIPHGHDVPSVVQLTLNCCNRKLVNLPALVWDALRLCRKVVNQVSPALARAAIRSNSSSYTSIARAEKLKLLQYCLSDKSYGDLQGLALLPLANGFFATFNAHAGAAYVCSHACPRVLLPNLEHVLVDLPENPPLHSILMEIAKSNKTQLRQLNATIIAKLLPHAMPKEWQSRSVVSLPHHSFPAEWFETFWKWATSNGCLNLFTDQLVVPFKQRHQRNTTKYQVTKLKASTPLTVLVFSYETCSLALLDVLEKLQVNCSLQSQFPYLTYNSQYFYRLTIVGVLDAIAKSSSSLQSVDLTSQEASTLREFLSDTFQGYTYSSKRDSVLRSLPMFATTADTLLSVSQISHNSVLKSAFLQPGNYDYVFSSQHLPRSFILFSRCDYHQIQLLQHLRVSSPDLFSFVLNTLVPYLKRHITSQNLSNVVQEMLDGLSWVTAGHRYGVQKFYQAIGGLEFVRTSAGRFCCPKDLFDPSDSLLVELYAGEPKFPTGQLAETCYLPHLRNLGLRTSITAQDVVEILPSFSSSSKSPIRVNATQLTRARAVLKYLNRYPHELSTSVLLSRSYYSLFDALKKLMTNRAWLPVCSTAPQGYPSSLTWKGVSCTSHLTSLQPGSVVVYSSQGDADSRKLPFVVGSQAYLVDLKASADVARIFTTDVRQLGEQIVSHFAKVITSQKHMSVVDVSTIVDYIYNCLHTLSQAGYHSQLQGLSRLDRWVWIYDKELFVNQRHVAVTYNPSFGLDLQPYLYMLPSSLKPHVRFFKAYGVEDSVTKSQIISILEMVRSGAHREAVSDAQAWQVVMSILNWLTANGTKKVTLSGSDTLLVPIESDSAYPQLADASAVIYADKAILRKVFASDDESDYAIAHVRIGRDLANCLQLTPLSEYLGITEDAFGDAGPNEPLTVRLKELLRDYKDGLTIIKELLQNADDAEASEVNICYDARTHTTDPSKLFFEGMAKCHGPALVVHNNQVFTDSDFENITKLGGATKEDKPLKIGKFGVGFCSVYHITDIPSFVTRDMLYVFDPTLQYLQNEIQNLAKPGKKVRTSSRIITGSSQLDPFVGLFGFESGISYQGTMFRFPFRTRHSKISSTTYSEEKVHDLLQDIREVGSKILLFLQHVNSITFHQIMPGEGKPTCLLRITKQDVQWWEVLPM